MVKITKHRQAKLASLTRSNCWRVCQFHAARCSTGARPAKFRACGWAGVAFYFIGRRSRPRYYVTSTADSRKAMAKGVLSSRRRPGRARGQPRATAGQNLCTGFAQIPGRVWFAQSLHSRFPCTRFARAFLPTTSHKCTVNA